VDTPDEEEKLETGSGNSFKAVQAAGPLLGSGIQLAAAVAFFFFVGRWLDGKLGTDPWLMLLGAFIGVGGGFYRFIKTAIDVGKSNDDETTEHNAQ
jgi:F0F1-type ATP synthase assembly protein I